MKMRSFRTVLGSVVLLVTLGSSAGGVLAAGVPIDAATPDQKKAAQARYESGSKAFGANKFDVALTEFTASYDTVASPNAHFMMARALNESGDFAKAYNELVVVEREAKVSEKYAATLEQSVALRTELMKKVGLVVVEVRGAGGKVKASVGGREVALGEQVAVAPGAVEVSVELDGKPFKRESAQVAIGETHPFQFDAQAAKAVAPPPTPVEPAEPASHGGRTGYWIAAGAFGAVAVGGFVMGAVEGSAAKSGYSDMESACPANAAGRHICPSGYDFQGQEDSVKKKQTLANVGWAIGGVGVAGAATMLIVGLTRKSSDSTRTGGDPIHVTVGLGSVGIDGRF